MTNLRKAAEMALDALEEIHVGNMTPIAEENWNKALTALRQALAQPEQEPRHWSDCAIYNEPAYPKGACNCGGYYKPIIDEGKTEPVAWKYDWYGYKSQNETKVLVKDWIASVYSEVSDPTIGAHNIRPLYAEPLHKEWVGLTDEERNEMIDRIQHDQYTRQRDLIGSTQIITEMYLKEKNT